ncbi:MAG: hypothetical protein FWH36_06300, partial [Lentimicrobiaceae bacterium]|nr:hypothetical protein [Lentimicrobiaceae bacterium]
MDKVIVNDNVKSQRRLIMLKTENHNLFVNTKGKVTKKVGGILLFSAGLALIFNSCGKCNKNAPDKIFEDGVEKKLTGWNNENDKSCTPIYTVVPGGEPENCDGPQNTYDAAAGKAASDSSAYVDYKATAPDQILGKVNTKKLEGMTEAEAWAWVINDCMTNPNAPQALKEWAQAYKNFLDAFDKSVAEREEALAALIACQNRLIKQ